MAKGNIKKRGKKGKVVAGVVGVAAAAAAGAAVVAVVRASSRGQRRAPKGNPVYHVQPHGNGWVVLRQGEHSPSSAHDTKKEALEAGRQLARSNEPSRLVVHRTDGSVMDSHSYGEEE